MRLLLILLAAGALFAQTDPDPREQAWMAHAILEQRLASRIPDLVRVIESPDRSSDTDAAKFAALDALIQLDAQVPLEDLEPLVDRYPTDILILASRSAQNATPLLLKLLDRPHNLDAFVAIGRILAPQRAPGFAQAAMKEFCQRTALYVFKPGQPHDLGGAWSGDGYRMADPQRTGWPEAGSYRFGGGSFIRTVDRGYVDHGFDFSGESSQVNSCIAAEAFLAAYTDVSPAQLPLRASQRLDLIWTGEQAFELQVRGYIAEQRRRYAILVSQLAARGYLTREDAGNPRLKLYITVFDGRKGEPPLPGVAAWASE